jgi:hypothetical protein
MRALLVLALVGCAHAEAPMKRMVVVAVQAPAGLHETSWCAQQCPKADAGEALAWCRGAGTTGADEPPRSDGALVCAYEAAR